MKKDKHHDDYICQNCQPAKYDEACRKLCNEVHDKFRELIREIVFKHKTCRLSPSDIQEVVADCLVEEAVDEQIWNRKYIFSNMEMDEEMITHCEDQYKYYLDKLVKAHNEKNLNRKPKEELH